jgi:hypothetical protein
MSEPHDEIAQYRHEAAAKFNVTLLVEPYGDGRFEALEAPLPGDTQSSGTARPICVEPTKIEAAQLAVEILRSRCSGRQFPAACGRA